MWLTYVLGVYVQAGGDAGEGGQPRKRARQALESDDEDEAAAVDGDAGDAAPMDEDEDFDALF